MLGYIDFRVQLLTGPIEAFTCLVGTMVQETFGTSPAIRAACAASICGHAQKLEADIAEAIELYGVAGVTASSLALYTQAALQGAFIIAKARGGPAAAADCVAHLRRYFTLLFHPQPKGTQP